MTGMYTDARLLEPHAHLEEAREDNWARAAEQLSRLHLDHDSWYLSLIPRLAMRWRAHAQATEQLLDFHAQFTRELSTGALRSVEDEVARQSAESGRTWRSVISHHRGEGLPGWQIWNQTSGHSAVVLVGSLPVRLRENSAGALRAGFSELHAEFAARAAVPGTSAAEIGELAQSLTRRLILTQHHEVSAQVAQAMAFLDHADVPDRTERTRLVAQALAARTGTPSRVRLKAPGEEEFGEWIESTEAVSAHQG